MTNLMVEYQCKLWIYKSFHDSSPSKESGAHVGFSFDGDGDRLIAIDEKGNIVDGGDHILAICGTYLHQEGRLHKDTVVGTVMTNMGLDVYLREMG